MLACDLQPCRCVPFSEFKLDNWSFLERQSPVRFPGAGILHQ